jgi:hypothetical protein
VSHTIALLGESIGRYHTFSFLLGERADVWLLQVVLAARLEKHITFLHALFQQAVCPLLKLYHRVPPQELQELSERFYMALAQQRGEVVQVVETGLKIEVQKMRQEQQALQVKAAAMAADIAKFESDNGRHMVAKAIGSGTREQAASQEDKIMDQLNTSEPEPVCPQVPDCRHVAAFAWLPLHLLGCR